MKVKIKANRPGTWYEDPEILGHEFNVFESPKYPDFYFVHFQYFVFKEDVEVKKYYDC